MTPAGNGFTTSKMRKQHERRARPRVHVAGHEEAGDDHAGDLVDDDARRGRAAGRRLVGAAGRPDARRPAATATASRPADERVAHAAPATAAAAAQRASRRCRARRARSRRRRRWRARWRAHARPLRSGSPGRVKPMVSTLQTHGWPSIRSRHDRAVPRARRGASRRRGRGRHHQPLLQEADLAGGR